MATGKIMPFFTIIQDESILQPLIDDKALIEAEVHLKGGKG